MKKSDNNPNQNRFPIPPSQLQADFDKLWKRPDDLTLTGKGTVLGVIDQASWLDHPAYKDNIKQVFQVNEETPKYGLPEEAPMHGALVLSIAVGEIGVAKDAKVVYCTKEGGERNVIMKNTLKAFDRLKQYVEEGNHLDAISVSLGWRQYQEYGPENNERVAWFEKKNIPVFTCEDQLLLPFCKNGTPTWYLKNCPGFEVKPGQVAFPIGHRLIASEDKRRIEKEGGLYYYDMKEGGLSSATPYKAGLFMLAREAQPSIARDAFEAVLSRTAKIVQFPSGESLPITDMRALEKALKPEGPRVNPKKSNRGPSF